MPPAIAPAIRLDDRPQNKKIVFNDDGEVLAEGAPVSNGKQHTKSKTHKLTDAGKVKVKSEEEQQAGTNDDEEDYFAMREQQRLKQKESKDEEAHVKWFNVYTQYPSSDEVLDMKESEQTELYNLCKNAFDAELPTFNKRNTSDARWLQTALRKGTARDRANAGALLVTSNPLGNLEALTTLISFTKISNKSSNEVIAILTDLWKEVLLPPHRKLFSLQMRCADWKLVRKDPTLSKEKQRRIYAYWYFESELKDQYFEFLKNLQHGVQTGQEHNKNATIVAASQLLAYAPEKEQMLLTMLINKLGDPSAKVASKALHHLTEVAHKHPNMCGVIVSEAEKLLFRNNISERAQHFALCFLASIAPAGRPEVCTKLVHICFSLFKVLVQKGAVNNRTMQAILRCLQKAILEAKPAQGSSEILSKDMQDTVYRLVHLADIRVSVQTLGLLLQLTSVKTQKSDRFYNALYKKLMDIELTNIGVKTAAQLLHIVHRAIHIDHNVQRAQAFIKRLLQVALYMPAHITAGCLIVIHKLLRTRKELMGVQTNSSDIKENGKEDGKILPKVSADDEELAKFDSDGEEQYEDVRDENDKTVEQADKDKNAANIDEPSSAVGSSWHHVKVQSDSSVGKVREMAASKYDAYHRVPAFAGAEFAVRDELLLLRTHFHPTVQVFADNILNHKRIDYYGDPLRDFGLPYFLERFAFKNPKKLDTQKTADVPKNMHKHYMAFGTRGKPVKSLTKTNCTEDEMYIFNYLEQKRQRSAMLTAKKSTKDGEEDDMDLKPNEVNDDEFEEYLDGFFGKKAKAAAAAKAMEDDEELDFLKELGGELKADKKEKKKKKKVDADDEEDMAEIDADWGDDNEADDLDAGAFEGEGSDLSDDEAGSLDENEEDDDDDGSISLDGENEIGDFSNESGESSEDESQIGNDDVTPTKNKKRKQATVLDGRSFSKKLKHSDDMSSLFAAADDFAELLEETGKTKGQGTTNALFNKDKSSEKQLKWEEKRHSNAKTYGKHTKSTVTAKKFSKKRKH